MLSQEVSANVQDNLHAKIGKPLYWRIVLGSVALGLWLVLFSCGIFVETIEYRAFLAPHAFPDHAEKDKKAHISAKPFEGPATYAFFVSMMCFTPTNLALLALLCGLVGGCASNIVSSKQETATMVDDRSRSFLEEHPWSAMVRSFIVYLCIIAGLYFVIDDPFKDSTPAQYVRMAGTISVLSLLVGYDPTRILYFLRLAQPTPSQQVTATTDRDGNVKLKATQGTPPADDESIKSEFHTGPVVAITAANVKKNKG
jgi:hypothetical protein